MRLSSAVQRPLPRLADQHRAVLRDADLRGHHQHHGRHRGRPQCAVLDRNDTPVPGLFAAGSTVGGLGGGPNTGYVGGLIKATIALRAAEAIAAA